MRAGLALWKVGLCASDAGDSGKALVAVATGRAGGAMARGLGHRRIAFGLSALAVFTMGGLLAPRATALEAFDGRLQAHGFVEMDMRAINSAWKEQTDLTQWYNILNVEFEADIAPDGFGPIDLLSAYVRVEARYDCIYSKGCGTFPAVSTFGNSSRSLPDRLSDAKLLDFGGTIPTRKLADGKIVHEQRVLPTRDPATPDELATFEGLFDALGADPLTANVQSDPLDPTGSFFVEPDPPDDDPARYTLEAVLDYKFAAKNLRSASITGAFSLMSPWIPRNKPIDSNGALIDKANPYRGRAAPVIQGAAVRTRFYEGDTDPRLASNGGTLVPTNQSGGPAYIDPTPVFDPAFLPLLETRPATDRSGTPYTELVRDTIDVAIPPEQVARQQEILDELFDVEGLDDPNVPGSQPLTADTVSPVTQTDGPYDLFNVFVVETEAREADGITPLDLAARQLRAGFYIRVDPSVDPSTLVGTALQGSSRVITSIERVILQFRDPNNEGFGGDFSDIIPFFPGNDPDGNFPNGPSCDADARTNIRDAFRCPNGVDAEGRSNTAQNSIDGINVSAGLIPLRNVLIAGGAGELPLRPAPDLSVLDSGANPELLFAQGIYYPSAGLRHALMTQDFDDHQFDVGENRRAWNRGASQDQTKELKEAYFDIETLESRLWLRIGRQNIVWGKTELFRTTDQFNPIDLALASLPTLEEQRIPVWSAKATYSVYDVGPLQDVRLEFATNFDEFTPNDLGACGEPYTIDIICGVTFGLAAHGFAGLGIAGVDRPPDPWNDIKGLEVGGRIEWRWDRFSFALIDFYGYNDLPFPDPLFFYERNVDLDTGRPVVTRFVGGKPGPQTQGDCDTPSPGTFDVEIFDGATPVPLPFDASKNWRSTSPLGIGTDSPCLKAGGAAGFQAENEFGGAENALYFHASNQQIHAFACSATLGVSSLDAQRCALALFGSPNFLQGGIVPFPLIEFFSISLSGEPGAQAFVIAATGTVREATAEPGKPAPLVALNRDRGPICDPDTGAPFATPAECVASLQAGGWDGIITASNAQINIPDPNAPMSVPFFNPETQMTEFRNCSANISGANNGPCRVYSFHYNPGTAGVPTTDADFLTLDSTLSNQQKALLGCGPFFGTRCDSSDVVETYFDASFPDCTTVAPGEPCAGGPADVPLTPQGGGIDLFNTDASFLIQSWAGIEGTGPEFYTPRLLAAFDAAEQERVDTLIPLCRDNAGPPAQPRFCRIYRPLVDLGGVRGVPQRFLEPLEATWLTTATSLIQPQTIRLGEYSDAFGTVQPAGSSFPNAQPCTVFNESDGTVDVLPGCRGIESVDVTTDGGGIPTLFTVTFQQGYLPSVDGCVFGGSGGTLNIGGVPVDARASNGSPVSGQLASELQSCADDSTLAENSNTRVFDFSLPVGVRERFGVPVPGAQALFHPLAGCLPDEDAASLDPRRNTCPFGLVSGETPRDFAAELAGTDPSGRGPENVFLFRSEGAAMSFNVQMFLAALSCNGDPEADIMADPECFDPEDSFSPARCSFAAPQYCENIKGIFGVAGVRRNTVKAGGTNGMGRRAFIWQTGGEVALRYNRRNVLGFSMDFAEDVTKTNWGMEFTWVGDTTVIDSNSPTNVSDVQTYNMTISVDRPTFINFLNPNRTFFFNTQWFFQYVTNYRDSMPSTGPFNVLFTFAILAGYFQDRLLPQFISIYDFKSRSGGFLPSVQYRFTENLSATIGMLFFFGETDFNKIPIRGFGPDGNRAGPDAYREPEENFISLIRGRDEVFLRLRWTF
jgi:hypothetical protein